MTNQIRRLFCALCVIYSVAGLCDDFDDADINWRKHNPYSTQTISHQIWDTFLIRYIHPENGINLLDYSQASKQGKKQLNKYIKQLATTKIVHYNRQEQKAFWINLYNALTVRLIVNAYPVESIQSVKLKKLSFSEFSPWDRQLVTLNGVKLTLNNIEHKILRSYWSDPRIHYAVNCASISCPNLANQAYTAENIEAMLNNAAISYINHPRAVKFIDSKTIKLSSIYQWYSEDFGGYDEAILSHLKQYAKQPLTNQLKAFSGRMTYHYNWDLNGVTRH
jgi:hypothetical protein